MTLASQSWHPCTVYEMHAAFLRAERHWYVEQKFPPDVIRLIDHADTSNLEENAMRVGVLCAKRRHLIGEIPLDTQWFRVEHLTHGAFGELRVIARCGWDAKPHEPPDANELTNVAARRPKPLEVEPAHWGPLILWGHDRAGPFTIVEGNNRLTAYAGAQDAPAFRLPVYVGLSPNLFCFHLEDRPILTMHPWWVP